MARHWRILPLVAVLFWTTTLGCGSAIAPKAVPGVAAEPVDYDGYERALARYLDDRGRVNYAAWKAQSADVDQLDRFLGALMARPPQSQRGAASLAYWMNLYNAIVIREVLRRWPLDSVRDVRAGLLNGSLGFFRGLSFRVGDTELSLDDIEHRVIREQYADARIHFALNCGAESCPPLRPLAFSAERLDQELGRATREFLAQPANFEVDDARRRVTVSKLFDWYGDDFRAHAERAGKPAEVLSFIALVGGPQVSKQASRAAGYQLRFRDYDWGVNRGNASKRSAQACSLKPGARLPVLSAATTEPVLRFPRARPVVIDVWATYCKPCRKTLPELGQLATRHPGVDVVALALDDDPARVADFLSKVSLGDAVRVVVAGSDAQEELSITSMPSLLVVSKDGTISACFAGVPDGDAVEAAVKVVQTSAP